MAPPARYACRRSGPRAPRRRAGSRSPCRRRPPRPPSVVANEPSSLSVSRIATGRPAASATYTNPTWTGPTGVVSSLSRPTGREVRHEVRHELLGPLAPQAARDVAVARVEVAADADRPPVVEPGVAAGARPAHEEPPLAVAQHEVRDHLLEATGPAPSRRRGRRNRPSRATARERGLEPSGADARASPPRRGRSTARGTTSTCSPVLAHAQSPLDAATAARPQPVPDARPCPPPLEVGEPPVEDLADVPQARGDRGAFVTAIPVPISTSPRASRVMLSQPPAARPTPAASRAGRSTRARDRLDERRRRATSGRWLIAATARSCRRRPSGATRAPQAAASASTRDVAGGVLGRDDDPRPVREQAGVRRLEPRAARGRPSGARRRTAGRASPASATMAPFVLATSVMTASGARAGAAARRGPEQVEAVERRRGEDDEVGPVDRGLRAARREVDDPRLGGQARTAARGVQAANEYAWPAAAACRARAIDPPMSPSPSRATRGPRPATRPSSTPGAAGHAPLRAPLRSSPPAGRDRGRVLAAGRRVRRSVARRSASR